MDLKQIQKDAEQAMHKAVDYLKGELRGIRTGRASTGLVEYVKVDYYGSPTDLKSLAAVSVPEPTQLLIKPFDTGAVGSIRQAIEEANLGVNPQVEDKAIRITLPMLTKDRRKELVSHAKKVGEEQKVVMRNARRDANKHADSLAKQTGQHYSEDEVATLKEEIQDLLKKYEARIDDMVARKTDEITEL